MKMKKKQITALLLSLVLIFSIIDSSGIQIARAAETKTIAGILICGNCRDSGHVITHTTGCCLMSSCYISGYGILVPENDKTYKYYALDAEGTTKAYELLQSLKDSNVSDYLSVNVTGLVDDTAGEYTYADKAVTKTVKYDGRISDVTIEYDGTHEAYTKNAAALSDVDVKIADISDQKYTGKSIKPSIKVTDGGYTLKEAEDYTVTYKANTNVGLAAVTIKGTGAYYKDTLQKTFSIISKQYSNPTGYAEENASVSYVEFGSYPQSEVTGTLLTTDIIQADYDINGDATVNGIKYRRISKADVTDSSNYEWADGEYRYFKYDPITWKVLKDSDNELFLQAATSLDVKKYNDTDTEVTWETSSIRSWLNNSFLNTAFQASEQAVINTSDVVNDVANSLGVKGGNDTKDKVFLLSADDITQNSYGFSADENYFSTTRRVQTTAYAEAQGTVTSDSYNNASYYWLRSPAKDKLTAGIALPSGALTYSYTQQNKVSFTKNGVVPVIRIQKDSTLWTGTANNPAYQAEQLAAYSHVELGSYPQSEVTGTELIPAIIQAGYDNNGDAVVDNVKYRRLNVPSLINTDDVSTAIQNYNYDSDGYYKENNVIKYRHLSETRGTTTVDYYYQYGYKYYKYEPIVWKVLNNDGTNLTLLADKGLDTKQYYDIEGTEVNWATSNLRTWLNNELLNSAFTGKEQSVIRETKVKTANSEEEPTISGGIATNDKVYLLSIDDLRNTAYGFNSDVHTNSESHKINYTDYSAGVAANNWTGFDVPGEWWLRSPGAWVTNPVTVMTNGALKTSGRYDIYSVGTVPVINISISALNKLNSIANAELAISRKSVILLKGDKVTLEVNNNIGKITWKSDNKKVVIVQNGKVTAVSAGSAYISATADGETVTSKITVVNPKINKTKITLKKNQSITLKVTESIGKVKWWVSNKSVISITEGKVTAKKKGSAYVYAKVNNKTLKTKVTVK